LLAGDRVNPEAVERLKQQDVLNEALREFGQVFPEVQRTLIHERDQYMAEQLRRLPAYPAVAVIGAGHMPGIKRILEAGTPVDLIFLESLPPRRGIGKLLAWGIPLSVCALITLGFFKAGAGTGGAMAKAWIVSTSMTGALGALMALAHPVTILVAAVVAPFTAVNPFLRSGWIAALCEALLRRPRVMDLESILDDMTSLRGWYRNRVSRVLLVMILVNLMGIVGSILGVKALASFFL
jgi:pheromone shutdown-related protein TraB